MFPIKRNDLLFYLYVLLMLTAVILAYTISEEIRVERYEACLRSGYPSGECWVRSIGL